MHALFKPSILFAALALSGVGAAAEGVRDYQIKCPKGDFLVVGCVLPGGKMSLCSGSALGLRDLKYRFGMDLESPKFQYPVPGEAEIAANVRTTEENGTEGRFVFYRERVRYEFKAFLDEHAGPKAALHSYKEGRLTGKMVCRAVEFNPLKD